MPDKTASLDVAIFGTSQAQALLDVYIAPLSAKLDVAVASAETKTATLDAAVAFGGVELPVTLDMWVAEGGAASQLFALDTTVSVPLILGPHIVSDPAAGVPFTLANLDPDVVAIALGPNALGITQVYGFGNNQDGTGQFFADFDTTPVTRTLSLVATDDVDNESPESPLFLVESLQRSRLNDELTIVPQEEPATPSCNRMIDAIPDTDFILRRQYTVPYSFNMSRFELRARTPGDPVDITVLRRGLAGEPDETQRYTVIPESEVTRVSLRLGRGANVITARDQHGRADSIIVAATTFASVLCAYAREIYNFSQVSIDEQTSAIFSPTSTRLAEPLLNFQDLLPDVKSQQTLATKLAVRSLVGSPGHQAGVRDMLTALTLSTPVFVEQNPDDQWFEPSTIPLYNAQEAFGGIEAHVWPANQCVARWIAFVRFLTSMPVFEIIELSENEILFYDENRDIQRHIFDFTAEECSLTTLALQATCFDNIDVTVAIFSEADLAICAATYPFDMRPVPAFPINPVADEVGVELSLDPGFDGYTDFSVTDHWDSGLPLDSQGAMPAAGSGLDACVFDTGYLVAPMLLASATVTADQFTQIAAVGESQNARAADLDILIDMQNQQLTGDLDLNIGLPVLTTGLDVNVQGVEQLTVGLSIAITA